MPKVAFSSEVGGWDRFNRSLKNKDLPPALEEQRVALETAVTTAMKLKSKQMRLQAEMLHATRCLRETIASGRRAQSRLRGYLKAEYGATNPQLIRHGIKPRPAGRFRPKPGAAPGALSLEGDDLPGETAVAEEAAGAVMALETPEPEAFSGAAPEGPEPAADEPVAGEPAVTGPVIEKPAPPKRPRPRARRPRG